MIVRHAQRVPLPATVSRDNVTVSLTKGISMLQGPATVSFYADDVDAARRWYAELLGIDPYFARSAPDGRPIYVEFRIGDYQTELGIIDSRFRPSASTGPGGAILYWSVGDLAAAVANLLAAGATEYEATMERGPGFVTASVVDPFGNVLGVMENVHYREIAATHASARAAGMSADAS